VTRPEQMLVATGVVQAGGSVPSGYWNGGAGSIDL
jgi:hypothetical protein